MMTMKKTVYVLSILSLASFAVETVSARCKSRADKSSESRKHGCDRYLQTNLISNAAVTPQAVQAPNADFVNTWGITRSSGSPFWVANNGTGVSNVVNAQGGQVRPHVTIQSLTAEPAPVTGVVFAGGITNEFVINGLPATFIFVTEQGTIAGWNGSPQNPTPNDAFIRVITPDAVYKGVTIATNATGARFLYVTNFATGFVEIYNTIWQKVGQFTDPSLCVNCPKPQPSFAPFNIAVINGQLYVTFALQNDDHGDDVAGAGNGFVDVFDLSGNLIKQLIKKCPLNAPWGLTVAPSNFGAFSNALLVGNFGNGKINAFCLSSGKFLGSLKDSCGKDLVIDGLWGLEFGGGALLNGATNQLFFTAGPNHENDGLFGYLSAKNA